jgi:hypothetical protein
MAAAEKYRMRFEPLASLDHNHLQLEKLNGKYANAAAAPIHQNVLRFDRRLVQVSRQLKGPK